jgi:hypothetical protein
MVDYLKEIDNGLIIEKPKIVLPWGLQKKDSFDMINNINVVNENYYTFKIVLTGISFINCAGLHFESERLSKIELFNDKKDRSELESGNIYNNHQLVLENLLGKARRNCLLEKMFKQVNKGDIEYRWKFKDITIIHKLWNRFGMEEVLEILINR